jgi:membrane protease YdiL (CAAX protease family)
MRDGSYTPPALSEVWVFFLAVLVINSTFVIGVGEDWIDQKYYSRGRLILLAGTLVAVVLISRGARAVLELIKPLLVWRISPLWFLAAVLLPIVISVSFVIGQSLLTGAPLELITSSVRLLQREGFLLNIFIIALVGEIVWVGYAISNLSRFYSRPIAAIITGTFWTLWWAPMVVYNIGVVPGLSFSGLWMNMVGVALFCAFFYTLTRSGLVILAMQFCLNCTILAVPVMPNVAGAFAYQVYAAIYMILGFVAVTVLLPKFLEKREAT